MTTASGEVLYVGGDFISAGGVPATCIAKWDGTAWSALDGPAGNGTDSQVAALAVYDDGTGEALYAAGGFETAGGVTVNYIAKWDGTAWSALVGPDGPGVGGGISALAVWDDGTGPALYAGGPFDTAGVTVNHIAKWDGTRWTALTGPGGTGTSSWVHALAVWDDGHGEALYVGGMFLTAGGVEAHHIARWDGTAWSALSGPSDTGTSGDVNALTVYDDGTGEALYVGGEFNLAGGVSVGNIAKWDGSEFSALGDPSGTVIGSAEIAALAVHDDGTGEALFAGGRFDSVGGVPSWNLAKWSCATALYLNQSRFKVDVTWSDIAGNFGIGLPVKLTDEAGYFWFFDEDNVELVVKALDACVDPFDRFWVFAAGLTNVAVTMTVTDTLTQVRKDYYNTQGQPFAPILDTDAFATCDGPPAAWSPTGELASLRGLLKNLHRSTRGAVASSGELRLNRNRFQVEVTWSDFAGNSGVGRAVELTDDTGYFWFFSDDNIEVVVKVLDACADPFNRFWVFAAGLTNVEVTMRVTDTVTGEEKSYHNLLNQEFAPILDTDAFATCDASGR